MKIIREYFIDALLLALLWTLGSLWMETSLVVQSFADLVNVFVLIVFVQFLYQKKPPFGYERYLLLSYGSLLWIAMMIIFEGPLVLLLFGSGFVFSLSIVFLIWSIIKG
jgi:hypothetical protein